LGVTELETGTFEVFDVVDFGAIEVKKAGLVNIDGEVAEAVGLIEHPGGILESHGVAKAGTATTDDGDPEASGLGFLGAENFVYFFDSFFGKLQH